ncbi:protein-L-isoaspartate O-methyltransferase [Paraburkholderia sp. GAS348]
MRRGFQSGLQSGFQSAALSKVAARIAGVANRKALVRRCARIQILFARRHACATGCASPLTLL